MGQQRPGHRGDPGRCPDHGQHGGRGQRHTDGLIRQRRVPPREVLGRGQADRVVGHQWVVLVHLHGRRADQRHGAETRSQHQEVGIVPAAFPPPRRHPGHARRRVRDPDSLPPRVGPAPWPRPAPGPAPARDSPGSVPAAPWSGGGHRCGTRSDHASPAAIDAASTSRPATAIKRAVLMGDGEHHRSHPGRGRHQDHPRRAGHRLATRSVAAARPTRTAPGRGPARGPGRPRRPPGHAASLRAAISVLARDVGSGSVRWPDGNGTTTRAARRRVIHTATCA